MTRMSRQEGGAGDCEEKDAGSAAQSFEGCQGFFFLTSTL